MKDLKDATATIPLTSLDNLRENNKKYHDLSFGLQGYTEWLNSQSSETNRSMRDFEKSLERYNDSKPKHPFLIK